jgi:organic hydroperoxide reductase OsmC/OhrA
MNRSHHYTAQITWTGNTGKGTAGYREYQRSHRVNINGKPSIELSSDPAFMGDAGRYNPEELLLSSLASCHMLWYLHLCADNGIVVTAYTDEATGTMQDDEQGGRFTEVVLRPQVTVSEHSMIERANSLHSEANKKCFIANSCNFPVLHQPVCVVE